MLYACIVVDVDGFNNSHSYLQVTIDVQIVYFIVAQDLKLLHDEYDINYEPLMMSSAQAALKVSL